jgi:hypothetical protein
MTLKTRNTTLLALALCTGLVGCGNSNNNSGNNVSDTPVTANYDLG